MFTADLSRSRSLFSTQLRPLARFGPIIMVVAVPALVFVLHSALFWWYIVDDAAISFVYSRSLAQGYGLVTQPGVPPVEGYSNFTWVVLCVPLFWLGLFDPQLTPKLLSVGLVVGSFALLGGALHRYFRLGVRGILLTLLLLASNTAFVVWTTAGLEGPLYAVVIYGLLYISTRDVLAERVDRRSVALAGVIAAIVAMTRPDGLLFAFAYPLAMLAGAHCPQSGSWRKQFGAQLAVYGLSFTVLFGSFMIFRVLYFGDVVPNTYHAKFDRLDGGLAGLLGKLWYLFVGAAEMLAWPLLVGLVVGTAYLVAKGLFDRRHYVLLVFLALSVALYIVLPYDFMGEHRFGLPFFLMLYPYCVVMSISILGSLRLPEARRKSVALLLAGFALAWGGGFFALRSMNYSTKGAFAPFGVVAEYGGQKFNSYAERLGLGKGSVLLPDVGGALYYSKLRVYDLGGLTDKTIARTMGKDQAAFYDYVFESTKPTFISTHQMWAVFANLDGDPRFRRDYVPIREGRDASSDIAFGVSMYSGTYVRKDAVLGKEETLKALQAEAERRFSEGKR